MDETNVVTIAIFRKFINRVKLALNNVSSDIAKGEFLRCAHERGQWTENLELNETPPEEVKFDDV